MATSSVALQLDRRRLIVSLTAALGSAVAGCTGTAPAVQSKSMRELRPSPLYDQLPTDSPDLRYAAPGSKSVVVAEGIWTDASRNDRRIAWRLYSPDAYRAVPLALFSPGGGGSRETGEQYGRHLASYGIASLHLQHPGSDIIAARTDRSALFESARDPGVGKLRYEDVGFAIQEVMRRGGALTPLFDGSQMGIYGHSLGAITAMIAAGQSIAGYGQQFAQPALKAAIALSPSPPREAYGTPQTSFEDMKIPILHVTGTSDEVANGDFDKSERRVPFDTISNVDQYLLILDRATHFTMGGNPAPSFGGRDLSYPGIARHQEIIRALIVGFFKAKLTQDPEAKAFLSSEEIPLGISGADQFLRKPAA